MFAGHGIGDLHKRLLNELQIFRIDADAGIFNPDFQSAVVHAKCRDKNAPTGVGELDGILQQVDQNLFQLSFIGKKFWQVVWNFGFDKKPAGA